MFIWSRRSAWMACLASSFALLLLVTFEPHCDFYDRPAGKEQQQLAMGPEHFEPKPFTTTHQFKAKWRKWHRGGQDSPSCFTSLFTSPVGHVTLSFEFCLKPHH